MTSDYPAEIHRLIENSSNKSLRGNELSTLIKVQIPEFLPSLYSCRNLRDYIRQNVPSVIEAGRSGADIVYGLGTKDSQKETGGTPRGSIDQKAWKTFLSPSGNYILYGHPETGELRVAMRGEELPEAPWVVVPSFSPEEHLAVAKEFVSTLPEPNRGFLNQSLANPRWWTDFHSKTQAANCADQWVKFRNRKLTTELQSRLQKLRIPRPQAESRIPQKRIEPHSPIKSRDEHVLLRRLAIAAIQRMSTEELRSIKIQLGYVVDEIER